MPRKGHWETPMQLLFSFILNFFPFVYLRLCLQTSVAQPELVILLPLPQGFMCVSGLFCSSLSFRCDFPPADLSDLEHYSTCGPS